MSNEPYYDGMPERLVRVEEKVDALTSKVDTFIKTATSPEMGFVSAGYLAQSTATGEREHMRIDKRIDEINLDHNGRLTSLENARTAFGYSMAGMFGAVILDIILHVTGMKP